MLRWWGSETRIVMCADRLVRLGIERRGQARVLEKTLVPIEPAGTGPVWLAALEALKDCFKATTFPRSPVVLVLSNRFVRYVAIPWNDSIVARDERLAFARHCFKERYGDVASNWTVQLGKGGYGESNVACAIDAGLINGVQEAATKANVRLESVQPYLMSVYNQFRYGLGENDGACLATVESDTLCLAWFRKQQWQGIKTRRISQDWARELDAMLIEEAAEGGLEQPPSVVHVFAPERDRVAVQPSGVRLSRLEVAARPGFSPITDTRFAMGLCGVQR